VVEKPAWYKRTTRINAPFPLLPLDRTSAPTLRFDNWSGPWKECRKSIHVRNNVLKPFGSQGTVEATVSYRPGSPMYDQRTDEEQISLPRVDSMPLFTRIPCRVEIICTSKSMASSSSTEPSSFTFPRIPSASDIRLELMQLVLIRAGSQHRFLVESLGHLSGFGTEKDISNIQSEVTGPVWIPDKEKPDKKGYWKESVSYTSYIILRCATPIRTGLIGTEVRTRSIGLRGF
jgi:hypothetical protein